MIIAHRRPILSVRLPHTKLKINVNPFENAKGHPTWAAVRCNSFVMYVANKPKIEQYTVNALISHQQQVTVF
jgi:hypothetical protein